MKSNALLLGIALASSMSAANATTFNLSTLNDYKTGSGRQITDHGDYTGINGTGTYVFNSAGVQQNPWTQSLGNPDQASINFIVPTMGNNAGKIYMSAGALFPIPTGQVLGQNQSGYSGDYNLGNGFPLYFAFSNPTYDKNCGFNCQTITPVPVTMDSLYLTAGATATITGYSDLGHTAIDTKTVTVPGSPGGSPQEIVLDWTGIEEIAISGGGYYVNDIEVNDPISSPMPEPASVTLVGSGLIALAGLAKRKLCR